MWLYENGINFFPDSIRLVFVLSEIKYVRCYLIVRDQNACYYRCDFYDICMFVIYYSIHHIMLL